MSIEEMVRRHESVPAPNTERLIAALKAIVEYCGNQPEGRFPRPDGSVGICGSCNGRSGVQMPDTAPHQATPTSRAASEAIRPKLGARRAEVLAWFAECGPAADNTLIEAMVLRGRSANGPRARRIELVKAGYLEAVGIRNGSVLWKVTEIGYVWLESDE